MKFKSLAPFLSAILLFGLVATAPIVSTGCKTPTQQKQTVNTLFTLGQGVNSSYAAYMDLVVTGKLPTNSVPEVSRAFNTFQIAFNHAVTLVAGNTNALPDTAAMAAAANFNTVVAKATVKTP